MSTIFDYKSELSETAKARFVEFLGALNDPTKETVRVFDPLSKRQLAELELIREVSAQLQRKKQDDLKKAAQTAAAGELGMKTSEESDPKEKAH